jgi:hypothetical protein
VCHVSDRMEPVGSVFGLDIASLNDAAPRIDGLEHGVKQIRLDNDVSDKVLPPTFEGAGMTCLACGIGVTGQEGFSSAEEQRMHFKTDWHRCNVKRKLNKMFPLSEAEFESVVMKTNDGEGDWEVGSLSGSETDSIDSIDETGEDTLTESSQTSSGPYFTVSNTQDGVLAVWKCLLGPDRKKKSQSQSQVDKSSTTFEYMSALKRLLSNRCRWGIILSRGGHFAAAIYDITPPSVGSPQHKPDIQEVMHKSFHKYVVRAKAGGKQSTQDASGKFARSAGSRLRRYNEMSLERDIVSTLVLWKETLASCQILFVAAPGSNGRLLLSGDAPIFEKTDERIRKVPFITRRPTISETKRVVGILLTLYRSALLEDGDNVSGLQKSGESNFPDKKAEAKIKSKTKQAATSTMLPSKISADIADKGGDEKEQQQQEEEEEEAERVGERVEEKPKPKSKQKRAKQKQLRHHEMHEKDVTRSEKEKSGLSESAIQEEILKAAAKANQSQPPRYVSHLFLNQHSHKRIINNFCYTILVLAIPCSRKLSERVNLGDSRKASAHAKVGDVPARLSSKPLHSEDAATRRARLAAAAEARLRALQTAASQQKLW